MFDNDFPLIGAKTTDPRSPFDEFVPQDWQKNLFPRKPEQQEPKEGGPVKRADALDYLQQYVAGMNRYQQAGTDVPNFGMQTDYAQQAGGPLVGQTLVAGSPSFDLNYPKIPGRNLEGIPNANDPIMREKLRQRLLKNPAGGEGLPGFLKPA